MLKHTEPPGSVSLTTQESEITDLFLQIVIEEDMSTHRAATYALSALPHPDPDFVLWLTLGRAPAS